MHPSPACPNQGGMMGGPRGQCSGPRQTGVLSPSPVWLCAISPVPLLDRGNKGCTHMSPRAHTRPRAHAKSR